MVGGRDRIEEGFWKFRRKERLLVGQGVLSWKRVSRKVAEVTAQAVIMVDGNVFLLGAERPKPFCEPLVEAKEQYSAASFGKGTCFFQRQKSRLYSRICG